MGEGEGDMDPWKSRSIGIFDCRGKSTTTESCFFQSNHLSSNRLKVAENTQSILSHLWIQPIIVTPRAPAGYLKFLYQRSQTKHDEFNMTKDKCLEQLLINIRNSYLLKLLISFQHSFHRNKKKILLFLKFVAFKLPTMSWHKWKEKVQESVQEG